MNEISKYIESGEIRYAPIDKRKSKLLSIGSKNRINYSLIQKLNENNSKYIYENLYDAIREKIESIMALEGYKPYSHTATIGFIKTKIRSKTVISALDSMRINRNKSKYDGMNISIEETKEAIKNTKEILKELEKI